MKYSTDGQNFSNLSNVDNSTISINMTTFIPRYQTWQNNNIS